MRINKSFNPRTHAGCDLRLHSRTKGRSDVSIHAPTRGATGIITERWPISKSFNPRTHAGCDLYYALNKSSSKSFNPRTHAGCDRTITVSCWAASLFQSTHPRGVRLLPPFPSFRFNMIVSIHAPTRGATKTVAENNYRLCGFNPRTHAGCDIAVPGIDYRDFRFNPRTHAGCDNHVPDNRYPAVCFNPRTHAGCDGIPGLFFAWHNEFQSTHPRGVRRW